MVDAGWHVERGPKLRLSGVERVPLPEPGPDEARKRRWDSWWQVFHADRRGAKWAADLFAQPVDKSAPLPSCVAKVVVFDRADDMFMHVILDRPVYMLRRVERVGDGPITQAELDALVTTIRRWPALKSVVVQNVSGEAAAVLAGLTARGISTAMCPPEMANISAYYPDQSDQEPLTGDKPLDDDDDESEFCEHDGGSDDGDGDHGCDGDGDGDEDEKPAGWSLSMCHRGFVRPALSMDLGEDVAELARRAQLLAADDFVTVSAPPTQRQILAEELDRRGVNWRADPHRDVAPLPYSGQPAFHAGLGVQLSLFGVGWLQMALTVEDETHRVTGSYMTDAFGDLIAAIRKAVTYWRPTYCLWDREPGRTHIIFVPHPGNDTMTLELWHDPDEIIKTARTRELLGRWTGPAPALAAAIDEAAHTLIEAAGPYGISANWTMPPPYGELDLLDALLADDRSPTD